MHLIILLLLSETRLHKLILPSFDHRKDTMQYWDEIGAQVLV